MSKNVKIKRSIVQFFFQILCLYVIDFSLYHSFMILSEVHYFIFETTYSLICSINSVKRFEWNFFINLVQEARKNKFGSKLFNLKYISFLMLNHIVKMQVGLGSISDQKVSILRWNRCRCKKIKLGFTLSSPRYNITW